MATAKGKRISNSVFLNKQEKIKAFFLKPLPFCPGLLFLEQPASLTEKEIRMEYSLGKQDLMSTRYQETFQIQTNAKLAGKMPPVAIS